MTPRTGVVLDGRYELRERIAIGGMGEVWTATDVGSGAQLAAKVMRPEFAGEQLFLDRIAAEARNSQHLVHPGIARTYDAGVVGGLGYLVMEYIEGQTLSAILKRERTLTPRVILDVVAQTADALAAAHAAGVVHRDIKPGNLLITPEGTVKLTDFGISIGENQAPMTDAGMVMGTAQYLPPEQAMGQPATGAGDIYALGIIAYEALAGRRPYTGTTQVDIAFAHVTEPLPALPATVDDTLRALVESMLQKDPSDRPSSAAVVATRARALLEDLTSGRWDPNRVAGAWRSARASVAGAAGAARSGESRSGGRRAASRRGATAAATAAPTASPAPGAAPGPGPTPSRAAPRPAPPGPEPLRRSRMRRASPQRQVVIAVGIVVLAALITLLALTLANLGTSTALAAAALVLPFRLDRTHLPLRGWQHEGGEHAVLTDREVR